MKKIHRFLSIFLCLTFLFSVAFSPIRARAYFDPAYSTASIVVGDIVVEGIKSGSKLIASALLSVWNHVVTPDFLKTCQGVLEIGSFFTSSTSYKGIYDSYSEGEVSSGQMILSRAFLSSVAAAYKTKTGITLSVPANDVSIYVPPESVWEKAELITSDRLNYFGFADIVEFDDVVEAVDRGNSLQEITNTRLLSLYGLLNTSFAEVEEFISEQTSVVTDGFSDVVSNLGSKINSLSTTLSAKFDSLETSVDIVSSYLHQGLIDLKSIHTQFGNSTLSKLDALNTSIQALNGFDLTVNFTQEFALLRKVYTTFGNATLDSLEDLIESTDNVTASIFSAIECLSTTIVDSTEALSVQLDELTVDVAFPDLDWLFDYVDSLESLNWDISHSVSDLYPVLTDLYSIFDSEEFLNALSNVSLSAERLASLEFSSFDIFDRINDLYSFFTSDEEILNALSNVSLSAESLASLNDVSLSIDSSLQSFFSTLEEFYFYDLLDVYASYLSTAVDFIDQLNFDLSFAVSHVESSLSSLSTFLQTDIVEILNDIKTSIKSIAGTTTADPGIGDDDSEDEANKQKIPLIPHINNGFQQGENYIGNVYTFLDDELAGFRVAALIFEEFAGISFFYKLIITSCSVGLIATLLGMALNVQSYSVSQRRREEAAQVRAQYRMQRSTAA